MRIRNSSHPLSSGLDGFSGQTDTSSCRYGNPASTTLSVATMRPTTEQKSTRRSSSGAMAPLRHGVLSSLFSLTLLVSVAFIRPASAVLINFENCLPDNYKNNQAMPLQWVPLYVDAVFDTEGDGHNLKVTAWGNVTGSWAEVSGGLPPANDPKWKDGDVQDGKIVRLPEADSKDPKATTLISKVTFLTYEPWSEMKDFCNDSLVNGSCPLAPTFDTVGFNLPIGLPSVNLSHDFYSSYAFTTFSVTFIIINGDSERTNIGCISAPVTPDLGGLGWMLTFLPFVALLFVGFATVFAAIFSPWGTTDVFKWTSNHGRDADLLRLVTPGFGDCLQYIQFIALTGGLTLNYPGFYQPVASRVAWSALMFNESFVSKAPSWQSLVDGIYVTKSPQGLGRLSELVGMAEVEDVWVGMMVWLMVIIASVFVLIQVGFLVRWLYRYVNKIPEEDLRAKNVPFSLGNVVRIVFNFFLFPVISLSTYQLIVAGESPAYTVALAVLTLILIVGFAFWLLRLIAKARPRSELFDDLPTLLLYGPLYNTYSDEAAGFALVPVVLAILRGVAVGCVQAYGVAQIAILASAEVIFLLTLIYFQPFARQTSMNAYHLFFSIVRLVTILLMVAFAPSLGVTEGPKGWIGYVILLIHGAILLFAFFLSALSTLVEVAARMLGAGGDDVRGGLTKILGMRQLRRRMSRREHGAPSRQSQLSSTAMLDAEQASKTGYIMPGGRVRSESAASIGGLLNKQHRSSSGMDSIDITQGPPRNIGSAASSFTPTTPGEASIFSFLPSPGHARSPPTATTAETTGPFYRPPRRKREIQQEMLNLNANRRSIADSGRGSQFGGPLGDPSELDSEISRGATPAVYGHPHVDPAPRTDYSTREVDFYYGVRGPALNSYRPGRKLGTGPADPTGPMATAAGWFRNMFAPKNKEKGKGFEVVRSARMPPGAQGDFEADAPPGGIPVAMSMLRNGPIESDDESIPKGGRQRQVDLETGGLNLLTSPREHPFDLEAPNIPRKSSRRHSGASHSQAPSFNLTPAAESPPGSSPMFRPQNGHRQQDSLGDSSIISRLPFERRGSENRLSSNSSIDGVDDFAQVDLGVPTREDRPTSYGYVPQHSISRVDPGRRNVDLLGVSAEVVDDDRSSEGRRH